MKKSKFIADQFEFHMGDRPFMLNDKVVVTPQGDDTFTKPLFGQIVGIMTRDPMNQPMEPFFVIKEDETLTTVLAYARQCKLRK